MVASLGHIRSGRLSQKKVSLSNLLLLKAYHSPFNTVVQVQPSYALGVKFVVNEHKACLHGADTSAMLEQPQLARLDCQWYSCALGLVTVDVNVSPGRGCAVKCVHELKRLLTFLGAGTRHATA